MSNMFSISLVTADSYQSTPLPELDVTFSAFRGCEIKKVPIIRIFGSTPSGIKTCLHIHGTFPYIYIPCTVETNLDSFMYRLATAIDSAINVSLGSAFSNSQHVYKIEQVSGIPIYGYHEKEHLFFKIYFYNPAIIKRTADLLQSGAVLNQSLQPHEAHIPFILQFMIDYNLYGMNFMNLEDVNYRQSTYEESKEDFQNERPPSLIDSQKYLPINIVRQSTCKLEVDAQASKILNRQDILNGLDLNPGIAAIWNDEKHRREVKGLQHAESQLLFTNSNERVCTPTDNDIYHEKRFAQRLQLVSQMTESSTSLTLSTLNYPLEMEHENNSLNTSHLLNHTESLSNENSRKNMVLNNELLEIEKFQLKQSTSRDENIDASFLDTEDMQLIDMLVNLAEGNEEEQIIDDDSMLGSQYSAVSNQIEEDKDDDEVEDLNITSLDLDSLSSWNSVPKTSSQSSQLAIENTKEATSHNEKDCIDENNFEDISLTNLPQCDGSNDMYINKDKQLSRILTKMNHHVTAKTKIRKSNDILQLIYSRNILNLCRLDHQDLDVYDVDKLINNETLKDKLYLNRHFLNENDYNKSHYVNTNSFIEFKIPAVDGNMSDHSSDSEIEQNITIEKQEARICAYKSGTKFKINENVVIGTPRKRRLDFENEMQSPHKRRNTQSDCSQNEFNSTPVASKITRSPRLTGRYSPLNVAVISPKANRIIERNESSTSKLSACVTPKRSNHQLRSNLLRERLSISTLEAKPVYAASNKNENINDTLLEKFTQHKPINLNKEKNDIQLNDECLTPSSNKEIRKRLCFANINESEIDSNKTNTDEYHCENLSLSEKIMNESNDYANIPVMNFRQQDKFVNSPTESSEFEVLGKAFQENEETNFEILENEEDSCNMTYTQYLNKKLESELDTPSFVSLENASDITKNKVVIITTKFNPPSRERIINSMNRYNIPECKSLAPFFSKKSDLIKQKESSNKNSTVNDAVPFKSCLDRVTSIKLWRRVKINEFYPSGSNIKSCDVKRVLAGYNSLAIQPIIQPPSSKNVRTWLKAKKYLLKKNNTEVKKISDAGTNLVDNIEKKDGLSDSLNGKAVTDSNHTKDSTSNEIITNNLNQAENLSQNSNNSQHSSKSNDSLNPSIQKILENPLLLKNNETQKYLGISYGQIEYSIESYSGDVANENLQNARGFTMNQYLTLLSVEVHVTTRGELLPDPEHDSVEAIFYAVYNDIPLSSTTGHMEHGSIVVSPSLSNPKLKNIYATGTACPTLYVSSENELLENFITLIRRYDPDILIGWEIEYLSWGYILQRTSHLGFKNFIWQISRISNVTPNHKEQVMDKDNVNDTKIPGRIVLDVWRIIRSELALLNYSFENVMYNVMRERISCPTFKTLTAWWKHRNITMQWRVINHYVVRVTGTLRILIQLDIIGQTCEHARLFGIQFYEVFSRGSQFRVESMMLRLAKPLNYIPVSPSIQQRARMRAPEALPLIMEPESVFYTDPLVVLDFQSLYPSIIIAYNYCFSTCLGRVEHIGQYEPFEFGATTLRVKNSTALKLQDKINFAPCGVAFVKPEVRNGILPRMLSEILNTRLMVKQSMKIHGSENHVLQRVLHSQQLGLKLIANVTYGYTAANFSGRMPCIEIGDSVVSKGRETLERAIKLIESTPKWRARVVYGDTDSLFILLPGKSRKDAFTIGAEIADTVTASNPIPVKLKFEKVLQPSILQTKKRYCGYMYESPEQTEPEYLAKGIETVRRDGCPAVSKILEKTLKILFDTKDVSLVKQYVTRQFDKILRRKISIQDLTFAKEFRGLHGYKSSACVPALELTRRLLRKDSRAIPRTGERVRYVIVAGAPNQPLIHCVRTPMEVMCDEGLNPNSVYYITKVIIAPLNRCLNLIGIDVNTWYREMCHRQTPDKAVSLFTDNQKSTIRQFFSTVVCASCGNQTQRDICENCVAKPSQTVAILQEKIRWLERTYHELTMICQSCTGYLDGPECESLDCPVLYRLTQAKRDLIKIPYLSKTIHKS